MRKFRVVMSNTEKMKTNPLSKLITQASQNSNSQIAAFVNARNENNSMKEFETKTEINSKKIKVNLIDPNRYQPRKEFDIEKIKELAESIKIIGQIEPIAVRKSENGRYELIVGERRLRAIKLLENPEIDVVIKEASDNQMQVMALAENLDREDLSDYEVGIAIDSIQHNFQNKTELAEYLGKTKKDIHRLLAFNSFPDWIKERLNLNPKLISKSISQSLKAFIESKEYKDTEHRIHVENALNLLEEGKLNQMMFVDYIKGLIIKSSKPDRKLVAIEKNYLKNGKKIGKYIFDENKLSIKLNSSGINEKIAEEIYQLIEKMINEQL
jgi:ParB family transcriptional regulator, chromosome partitioning protein